MRNRQQSIQEKKVAHLTCEMCKQYYAENNIASISKHLEK